MVFSWFDTEEVDAFADSIAEELMQSFPLSEIEDPKRKGSARLKRAQDLMFKHTESFALAHPLNIYKRARLGNRFKWSLRSASYPAEFVDALTYELVRFVTLKGNASAKEKAQKAQRKGT